MQEDEDAESIASNESTENAVPGAAPVAPVAQALQPVGNYVFDELYDDDDRPAGPITPRVNAPLEPNRQEGAPLPVARGTGEAIPGTNPVDEPSSAQPNASTLEERTRLFWAKLENDRLASDVDAARERSLQEAEAHSTVDDDLARALRESSLIENPRTQQEEEDFKRAQQESLDHLKELLAEEEAELKKAHQLSMQEFAERQKREEDEYLEVKRNSLKEIADQETRRKQEDAEYEKVREESLRTALEWETRRHGWWSDVDDANIIASETTPVPQPPSATLGDVDAGSNVATSSRIESQTPAVVAPTAQRHPIYGLQGHWADSAIGSQLTLPPAYTSTAVLPRPAARSPRRSSDPAAGQPNQHQDDTSSNTGGSHSTGQDFDEMHDDDDRWSGVPSTAATGIQEHTGLPANVSGDTQEAPLPDAGERPAMSDVHAVPVGNGGETQLDHATLEAKTKEFWDRRDREKLESDFKKAKELSKRERIIEQERDKAELERALLESQKSEESRKLRWEQEHSAQIERAIQLSEALARDYPDTIRARELIQAQREEEEIRNANAESLRSEKLRLERIGWALDEDDEDNQDDDTSTIATGLSNMSISNRSLRSHRGVIGHIDDDGGSSIASSTHTVRHRPAVPNGLRYTETHLPIGEPAPAYTSMPDPAHYAVPQTHAPQPTPVQASITEQVATPPVATEFGGRVRMPYIAGPVQQGNDTVSWQSTEYVGKRLPQP
ncbi:hypothetical protein LTS10_012898 [Elasticomyces elasticus]|nr:hypothetical protein LTS10_012898 [Elasticomyces elasticus]